MPEPREPGLSAGRSPDPLTDRIFEVVDAGLELGASLARSIAGATGSKDVTPRSERPIDDIVKYGTATAENLVHLVTSGASRFARDEGDRAGAVAPGRSAPATAGGPMVKAGSTLRVPLLVENTGTSPTRALTMQADSVTRSDCPDGSRCTCISVDTVSFAPETLVVAARDFEKLTVRITAPSGSPPGAYRAAITAGDGWFSTVIAFTVVSS